MKETRKWYRRTLLGVAERLRDLGLRLSWKLAVTIRRRRDPDDDAFGRFLKRAGDAANPERDRDLMPYWLVTRRMSDRPFPEALDSAWLRFRGRRSRDPERARLWREYVLDWTHLDEGPRRAPDRADVAADESSPGASAPRDARAPRRSFRPGDISISLHEAIVRECFDDCTPAARQAPRRRSLRHGALAVALTAVVGLVTWMSPALRPAADTDFPPVSTLGIEQLERGSKSLVEQALRARYIETLHEVQRLRITRAGDGMDFERILLEGARLDVERAIERHRRAGRVPPRLYLLLGKLSLLTEFETDGRRALARAANHGGAVGREAQELLTLLP